MADEVRPAYLELTAAEQGGYHVLWKQPVVENKRLPIDPTFPVDCNLRESAAPEITGSALIKQLVYRMRFEHGPYRDHWSAHINHRHHGRTYPAQRRI